MIDSIKLDNENTLKLRNGMTIYSDLLDNYYFVYNDSNLIGVGEVISNKLKLKTHF